MPSGPLYFVVQEVRGGQLLALSTPSPFRVGSSWLALYNPCSDHNVLSGCCQNPERPQIYWEGFCRLLCASHADCSASLCGPPVGGVRIRG